MTGPPDEPPVQLRDRMRRRAMTLGVSAALLVLVAVLCPVGLMTVEPLAVQMVLGLTDQVEATVQQVTLSEPGRPGRRGGTPPKWTVDVQWGVAGGAVATGRGILFLDDPVEAGDQVTVVDLGAGEVSFFSRNTAWLLVFTALGLAAMAAATAVWCRQRRRRWTELSRRPGSHPPVLVRVKEARFDRPRRWERPRWVIDYTLVDRAGPGGTMSIEDDGEHRIEVTDRLSVWSSDAQRRRPFLVRRAEDDTWLLGGGPDPVPPFGPPGVNPTDPT